VSGDDVTFTTWYELPTNVFFASLEKQERGGDRRPPDRSKYSLLCIRVAEARHVLAPDTSGGLRTGNSIEMP
jgi:hypothetical protein